MQLYVKNLSGRSIIIDITPQHTGAQIRQLVCDSELLNFEDARVMFRSFDIDNDKTAAELGISDECMMHLCMRLRGGGRPIINAPKLGNANHQKVAKKLPDDPEYTCIEAGLNILFNCCMHGDHGAVQCFNFGTFQYDELQSEFACSNCHKTDIKPIAFIFINCHYEIQAEPVNANEKEINIKNYIGDDKAVRFSCEGDSQFKSFTIITTE